MWEKIDRIRCNKIYQRSMKKRVGFFQPINIIILILQLRQGNWIRLEPGLQLEPTRFYPCFRGLGVGPRERYFEATLSPNVVIPRRSLVLDLP